MSNRTLAHPRATISEAWTAVILEAPTVPDVTALSRVAVAVAVQTRGTESRNLLRSVVAARRTRTRELADAAYASYRPRHRVGVAA